MERTFSFSDLGIPCLPGLDVGTLSGVYRVLLTEEDAERIADLDLHAGVTLLGRAGAPWTVLRVAPLGSPASRCLPRPMTRPRRTE